MVIAMPTRFLCWHGRRGRPAIWAGKAVSATMPRRSSPFCTIWIRPLPAAAAPMLQPAIQPGFWTARASGWRKKWERKAWKQRWRPWSAAVTRCWTKAPICFITCWCCWNRAGWGWANWFQGWRSGRERGRRPRTMHTPHAGAPPCRLQRLDLLFLQRLLNAGIGIHVFFKTGNIVQPVQIHAGQMRPARHGQQIRVGNRTLAGQPVPAFKLAINLFKIAAQLLAGIVLARLNRRLVAQIGRGAKQRLEGGVNVRIDQRHPAVDLGA